MSGDGLPAAEDPAVPGWDVLVGEIADRYRLHVESASRGGKPRYVAVARRLDVRPYAVVTSDPAELLAVLGCRSARPVTARGEDPDR
jgi:hypothetical protein